MSDQNSTVVVIEDDRVLSKTLSEELEDHGYHVVAELNGKAGLKAVRKHMPAIVLLDLNLPKREGLQVLFDLKESAITRKIPVVIMTVLSDYEHYSKGIKYGALDYIIKSDETVYDVVNKVDSILGRK